MKSPRFLSWKALTPRIAAAVVALSAALLPIGCSGEGESGMVDPGEEGPPELMEAPDNPTQPPPLQ
ncbi:hypothetical protein [Alienimonas chondri]|uniref:Uncharacterized protein n=1 Tax=Alienimonas chondri TaxID=2681879 RepID=A0ABX1VBE5_9PLAN|nr:hypothetical protein [Alienimonas chondri]NNJ25271.1 hypothetical protein [Alienimonas chondri]